MKSHDPPLPTAQDYVAALVDTGTWKGFSPCLTLICLLPG